MKNQLTFFPTPYEDEDFKSLVYRYHIRSVNNNIILTIKELFNIKTHRVAHFPRNLDYLVERIPGDHFLTSDYLIENHTLLALFLPFLTQDERNKILKKFKSVKDNSEIGAQLLSPIIATSVRYCPMCLVEDFERYREIYIHRVHQYNFIAVCSAHHLKLITHCPKCYAALSDNYGRFILRQPKCPRGHFLGGNIIDEQPTKIQLFNYQLARDTKFIIDNVNKLNVEIFKERMLSLCSHKEYLESQGMFLNKKFSNDFSNIFDEELLKTIGCNSNYLSNRAALKLLKFDGRLKNPLLYILGMQYLGESVERFVSFDTTKSPFGRGPWPCKNSYCPDYSKLVIYQYKRRSIKATQSIIGEFTCPSCGMIYSHTTTKFKGIEQEQTTIVSIGWRVAAVILDSYLNNIKPDEIFEELKIKPRQCKMIEQKANYTIESVKKSILYKVLDISIHEKSIEDVINLPDIPHLYLDYLLNPIGWMYGDRVKSRLEKEKTLLMECIQISSDRDSVRRSVGESTYNWLMKKDPIWMNTVLPSRDYHFKSLDWDEIDEELEIILTRIVSETYAFPPKTRILKYTLIKRFTVRDKARIERFPEKLPRTVNLLEKSIESTESYQIRRIPGLIDQVKKSTWALTLDNLLKIPVLKGCSNNVTEKVSIEFMKHTH